jgi:4-hydroxy-3-polyprenylbenzoate decarboxylase
MPHPIVLAISGASGAIYAVRLLEVLVNMGYNVHLTISPSGAVVLKQELDLAVDLDNFQLSQLMLDAQRSAGDSKIDLLRQQAGISSGDSDVLDFRAREPGQVVYHHHRDFLAPIASGSFLTNGMVVCPCSGGTLSAIVYGSSHNLIHRAADVHLKERRKLIVVPRETPLSTLQLENMHKAALAGAVVLPAMPGWYHGVRSIRDLVDFIVGRILDQLGIEQSLIERWGAPT